MPAIELFLVELRVADRAAVVAWYIDVIGLIVTLDDPNGDFTLMAAGPTRLAIKGGRTETAASSFAIMFRVDDISAERDRLVAMGIDVSAPKTSPEGYSAILVRDPAGNSVRLFQWAEMSVS